MKNIFVILCATMLVFSLFGCADKSAMLELRKAQVTMFTEGMKACGKDEGCKVGLTAFVFGGGLDLPQEETISSVLVAAIPYARTAVDIIQILNGAGGGGGNGMLVLRGNNNTIIGVGNRMNADHRSSVGMTLNSSQSATTYTGNRQYTLGGNSGSGGINYGAGMFR